MLLLYLMPIGTCILDLKLNICAANGHAKGKRGDGQSVLTLKRTKGSALAIAMQKENSKTGVFFILMASAHPRLELDGHMQYLPALFATVNTGIN